MTSRSGSHSSDGPYGAAVRRLSACIRCQTSPIVGRVNCGSGFTGAGGETGVGRPPKISSSGANCGARGPVIDGELAGHTPRLETTTPHVN
jgi:hypothetical protein